MDAPVIDEIVKKIKTLPNNLQRRVLIFIDALQISAKHGDPGEQLLQFAGLIPTDDLILMRQAIEIGCEQTETNEW